MYVSNEEKSADENRIFVTRSSTACFREIMRSQTKKSLIIEYFISDNYNENFLSHDQAL